MLGAILPSYPALIPAMVAVAVAFKLFWPMHKVRLVEHHGGREVRSIE